MENKDITIRLMIGVFIILVLFIIAFNKPHDMIAPPPPISVVKEDSLKNVIDSLQTEIFTIQDGCDYREHRYEDALFEYDLGLSYLKEYHPTAYKDFHRIIGMKERYSHELERENKTRLNSYEQHR